METLVLFILAVFLIWRLVSVLGQRTGNEKQQDFRRRERDGVFQDDSSQPTDGDFLLVDEEEQKIKERFKWADPILQLDRDFSPQKFIDGAKKAFEIIIQAYAEGNQSKLQKLLSPAVFKDFEKAIQSRNNQFLNLQINIQNFSEIQIQRVDIKKTTVSITVFFATDQKRVLKNKAGEIIEGDTQFTRRMNDVWVFERDVRSQDPIWILTETDSLDD